MMEPTQTESFESSVVRRMWYQNEWFYHRAPNRLSSGSRRLVRSASRRSRTQRPRSSAFVQATAHTGTTSDRGRSRSSGRLTVELPRAHTTAVWEAGGPIRRRLIRRPKFWRAAPAAAVPWPPV